MTRPTFPCIDHSVLSPSGRVSKRAREAKCKLEYARLFAGCGDLKGESQQPSEKNRLLAQAQRLRELASRGMSPRKFTKEATRLEQIASMLP